MRAALRKVKILGVDVTATSRQEVLESVDEMIAKEGYQGYIVTPNPEMIVLAKKDPTFTEILNHARISLVDGIGLFMAAKFLQVGRIERITGVDFLLELCSRYQEKPVKLGFLGGRPHVAEKAVECLLRKYPQLTVSFVSDEWTRQGFANARLLLKKHHEKMGQNSGSREIAEKEEVDILFVAFGFPKQEYFMAEHLPNMPVKLGIGVGGAFDYISGSVIRAPRMIRALGLEWFFRLVRQPWRARRQLALISFVGMVIVERIRKKTR